MDKIDAMRTFIQIATLGNLTRAAEKLNVSLPTVVRSLAGLEASLGVRLMNRTTRHVMLTEEGRHYLSRCTEIVREIDDIEAEISQRKLAPQGVLRVTAPYRFGQLHVAPCAVAFAQLHPQIEVNLLLIDRMVNLVEEGIDIAVRIGQLADSSLTAIRLGEVRQVVCASPAYLERRGTPSHPTDLSDHDCVHLTGLTQSANWPFLIDGQIRLVPVKSPFVCNQAAVTVDACVAGLGIGRFLSYQVQAQLQDKSLELLLVAHELPALPVSLVIPQGRLLPARVRAFLDWAKPRLREALAE